MLQFTTTHSVTSSSNVDIRWTLCGDLEPFHFLQPCSYLRYTTFNLKRSTFCYQSAFIDFCGSRQTAIIFLYIIT